MHDSYKLCDQLQYVKFKFRAASPSVLLLLHALVLHYH